MAGSARWTLRAAAEIRRPRGPAGRRGALLGCLALASSAAGVAFAPAAYAQDKPKDPPAEAGAAAPEGSDVDRARTLAKQAKRLLEKAQSYSEALDYATRAESLYHAPIHLAIIGEALVGMGRLTEAMDVFERLVSEPLPPTASDAFRAAQEDGRRRLKELSARVPSLLLVVKGPPPGTVKATVDGKPLSLTGGVATHFDPGVHKIHAAALGYMPFDQTVTLPSRGGVVEVEAPLEVQAAGGDRREVVDAPALAPSRAPWIAAFSVGGAGLLVGGIAGGLFVSRLNALKARCPNNVCAASDQAEAQSIGTIGNVSTAGWIVGGAGVATGGVLLLVQRLGSKSPPKAEPARASSSSLGGFEVGLAPFCASVRGRF